MRVIPMRPAALQTKKRAPLTSREWLPIRPAQPDRPAGKPDYLSRSIRCDGFGGVSRAAKGADCKSAGYAFVGSSPTSPTRLF
jgi:hypothetical protein